MRLSDQRIIVQNSAEQHECAKAAEYGSRANTIYTGIYGFEFGSGTSHLILRGLARLSLQESETDFHGLTPQAAYGRISELCGKPEDHAPKDWFAKT